MKKVKGVLIAIIIIVISIMSGCAGDSVDSNNSDPADNNIIENSNDDTSRENDSYNGDITLKLSFGERTGKYKGDLVNGLPDGYGEFTTQNNSGDEWTYKGELKEGHFNGEGQTVWSDGSKEIGFYVNDKITPMSEAETKKMIIQPENYKDHCVELTGLIFTQPEYYDDGVAIQMYTDIENHDNNVIVYLYGSDIELKDGDMIRVIGIVGDEFKGENAFGAELILPTVHASSYEIISYEQLHPIIASSEVKQTQTQLGYSVTVQKVEITNEETRIYIKVDNGGSANFNLYSFNTKIIQNGKQYEEQSNWDAEYPEVQTDLYPGVSTEGIITYPPIKGESFKIILEGSSEDYSEDIDDYIFDIEFNN